MNHLPNDVALPRDLFAVRFSLPRARATGGGDGPGTDPARAAGPKSVSPELMPLLAVELPAAPAPPVQITPSRRSAVLRSPWSDMGDRPWDEDEIRRLASRGAGTFFMVGGRGQSSGQSTDQDGEGQGQGQNPTPRQQTAVQDGRLQRAAGTVPTAKRSHMSGTGASLAQRCAEHHESFGDGAMSPFLRQAVIDLLPAFVRDLGSKLHALGVDERPPGSQESIRPVVEVCDEFFELVRPLYSRYVMGPNLLTDVRNALCTAQATLCDEVARWTDGGSRLEQVMYETVNPLFAILLMSCVKAPVSAAAMFDGARGPHEESA